MASMREIFAAFVRNGRWDVAEQLCRAVIDFVKDDAELVVEARGGLEFCLWSMGRGGEAWALHQQNRAAGHADAVVGMQFSCFAHDYEGRNVGKLGYRGHQVVAEAVLRLRPVATTMRVLDLGAGTGLLGAALRPYASHLTGVDLSPEMVREAQARGIYDELASCEILTFLAARTDRWDVAVASSVLQFIPELDRLFQLVADRLNPGGLLVATIDRSDPFGGAPCVAVGYGVFAYSREYVVAAAAAGLDLVAFEDAVERLGQPDGPPVASALISLRRPV